MVRTYGVHLHLCVFHVRVTTVMLCGNYLRLGELADREKLGVLKLHDTKRGIYWKFVYPLEVTDVTQLFRHE